MSIDYNKYIKSTGTHYIANSGGDEKGGITGGKAGDQTGKEWQLRSWYDRPWTCVLRHPDPKVRRLIAELGIEGALNDQIGYDQGQRLTFWQALEAVGYRPKDIKTACEEDCSAGVAAIVKAVGYLLGIASLQKVSASTYSGNAKANLKAAGFEVLTDAKYTDKKTYLLPGDVLLYVNHHAAINVTRGSKATGEVAETVDTTVSAQPVSGPCVQITNCSECNVRTGPGTSYTSVGTARSGDVFSAPDTEGWVPIVHNGQVRWVSAKYALALGVKA